MHKHLLSSPLNVFLTLVSLVVIYNVFATLINWLVLDAQWRGNTPDACPDKSAACWPFIWARFNQFMYGLYPATEQWRINLGVGIGVLLTIPLFFSSLPRKSTYAVGLLFTYCVIGVVLFRGGLLGLVYVDTTRWGGFFLTIVAAVFVMSTSLPIGIALALGRRSQIPFVRALCTTWIELWRSVPVLVVLFIAIVMFPLFMPAEWKIDKLLRALIALTILMSCYLAEAIRGALQSIPVGQYEAAKALGLNYWRRTSLIILPQAIPIALPQITSNFIGLFKETTILLVIGLFDLLGMVQTAASDPNWLSAGTNTTGYFFVAAFFWLFCFSFSRYTAYLEKRISVPQQEGIA